MVMLSTLNELFAAYASSEVRSHTLGSAKHLLLVCACLPFARDL